MDRGWPGWARPAGLADFNLKGPVDHPVEHPADALADPLADPLAEPASTAAIRPDGGDWAGLVRLQRLDTAAGDHAARG